MSLPINFPIAPMLARSESVIPPGDYYYEPKWDGFRTIVFRDSDEVILGSRNQRPMTRYFPELVKPITAQLPEQCVVDGEIVIMTDHGLDFDLLTNRIHPADSRVRKLATQTPASFIAFDVLAVADRNLMSDGFAVRRSELEEMFTGITSPLFITPMTTDLDVANQWFAEFEGAGLDGIVAKARDLHYVPDKRMMIKIKHERTADCVVAGYREHKAGGVGSLLLGLFDDRDVLHHVGVCSGFATPMRSELARYVQPLVMPDDSGHPWSDWIGQSNAEGQQRKPGASSRWNAGKELDWVALQPELVAEVRYDHMQRDRFRHATQFVRWREDRDPRSCRYDQTEEPRRFDLEQVLNSGS